MAAPQISPRIDVEEWVNFTNDLGTNLGDIELLGGGFPDLVTGINHVVTDVGTLANLETTDQTSIVAAMNELKRSILVMSLVFTEPIN